MGKMIFWKNGFWQREQQSLGISSYVQAYLNYLCYFYLLDRSQYLGITFYNETPVGAWLYFQLFSGVTRQCRISRGKRLICYLMQLNSICQAILFTCPWRDWGMRAINVFPEVVSSEGTDSRIQDSSVGCKSSGETLLHLSYFSQKCFSLTCVCKGTSIPFIHISLIKRILNFF